jgi:hypothetical protein
LAVVLQLRRTAADVENVRVSTALWATRPLVPCREALGADDDDGASLEELPLRPARCGAARLPALAWLRPSLTFYTPTDYGAAFREQLSTFVPRVATQACASRAPSAQVPVPAPPSCSSALLTARAALPF